MTLDLATLGAPRSLRDLLRHDRIALFGASPAAAEVESLLSEHGKSVAAIFDNAPAKHGSDFRGHKVRPGADAKAFAQDGGAIIIAAAYQSDIAAQLVRDLVIPRHRVFPFVSPMFAGHFGKDAVEPHLSQIDRLLGRVADKASRDYVEALIRFRWAMDPLALARNPNLKGFYSYDHADLGPHPGDHIVDCGAYTGDTAQAFLGRLGGQATVTAIEPLKRNYAALKSWISTHHATGKVTPIRAAVGSHHGVTAMTASGDDADPRARADMSGEPSEIAPVETLDRLFLGGAGRKVDFVKIDIEGYEIEALEGARNLIRSMAPDFAIAGYHRPGHLWEIPERLDAIRPGYRIFVGHHPSAVYECEFFCTARAAAQAAVA